MSTPYLNRGESIVMTTHRVSVGTVLFDALLTNERLILMDSRYTRFEPRMIHFPAIISVKGGKVPTGEPAIILTLAEPSDLSGSEQVNLIFSQLPGEQRKHERELWVRKIIELVIIAREKAAQKKIVPTRKKSGMQPSVRRWVAPEPLRPHSSVIKPDSLPPPVVVVSEEPDSLEFFLEEESPGEPEPPEEERTGIPPAPEILPAAVETVGAPESDTELPEPVTIVEAQPEEPASAYENPAEDDQTNWEEKPGAGLSISKENTPVESPPAAVQGSPALPEPAEDIGPSVSFASMVLAVTQSLKSHTDSQEQPDADRSSLPDTIEPAQIAVDEIPVHDTSSTENHEVAEYQSVTGTNPVPDPGLSKEPGTITTPAVRKPVRELPGTYTPDIPDTGIGTGPQEIMPRARTPGSQKSVQASRGGRPVIIAGALVLAALLLLLAGGIIFLSHYPFHAGENQMVITTPAITVAPAPSPGPVTVPQTGAYINVIYPGTFVGTIGNPGFLHQVSGTGNRTFPVLMITSIIQATIRKQDNYGEALTVEIYDNSTLLSRQTVRVPMGEINLLIDTKTGKPPGMKPGTTPADNRTLPGNGPMVYY
jgi:hypothetical protein